MPGKDPTRQRAHRPPFAMSLTEEGRHRLENGPVTIEYVGLTGRTQGGMATHKIRTIKGTIIDVDALSVTISEPNLIQTGIHTITLFTDDDVAFAHYKRRRVFLESAPGTPLLWTLNMHFSGHDIRGITFINNLIDTTGTRVLNHEDLGVIPRHPRHPKVQRRHHHRRPLQPKKALSDRPADQSTPWKIGDVRWSSHNLGESWLPADGSIQERAQFPDLAALSSTWSPPDLSAGWTQHLDVNNPFRNAMITDVAANDETYVAVGCNSNSQPVIMYSRDGQSWSTVNAYSTHYPTNVTWIPELGENGLFVMGGLSASENGILTSPDGETWTKSALKAPSGLPSDATGHIDAGKQYDFENMSGLATGHVFVEDGSVHARTVILDNKGNTLVSDNGCTTWKYPSKSGTTGFTDRYNRLAWGQTGPTQGLFIAGGQDSHIATSPDGITWTPCTSATAALGAGQTVSAIAWGRRNETAGTFIITSESGIIIRSEDGENWEVVDQDFHRIMAAAWTPIGQDREGFVISGYGARECHFMTSLDGQTWDKITWGEIKNSDIAFSSPYIHDITYGRNRLLMGGSEGLLVSRIILDQSQFCLPDIDNIAGIKAHIKAL